MKIEVLREQPEGVGELSRLDCGFFIIGLEQSHVYCMDEGCKSRLDKNVIFQKLPSSIMGVALYSSPYNPYETRAVINQEMGR